MRKVLAGSSSRQSGRGVVGEAKGKVSGLAGADLLSGGVSLDPQQGQGHALSFSVLRGLRNFP